MRRSFPSLRSLSYFFFLFCSIFFTHKGSFQSRRTQGPDGLSTRHEFGHLFSSSTCTYTRRLSACPLPGARHEREKKNLRFFVSFCKKSSLSLTGFELSICLLESFEDNQLGRHAYGQVSYVPTWWRLFRPQAEHQKK